MFFIPSSSSDLESSHFAKRTVAENSKDFQNPSEMVNGISSHEMPQNSLQIKQEDKFFSRLMSKDTSMANSSSRVYYGRASGAIPFVWESQPGTPKHILFIDDSLPPLTPPPSYQSAFNSKTIQKNLKPNRLSNIFSSPCRSTKKNHVSPSTSWSCTSSSSSSSSFSSSSSSLPRSNSKNSKFHRCKFSCSTLPIHYGTDDDEENNLSPRSPTSTPWFHGKRRSFSISRSCYSMANMKNALLSIVGRGSGQGTA